MTAPTKLTYFRINPTNTKYYTEGELQLPDNCTIGEAAGVVRALRESRSLPGLVKGHSPYHVLIELPEREPYLLVYTEGE